MHEFVTRDLRLKPRTGITGHDGAVGNYDLRYFPRATRRRRVLIADDNRDSAESLGMLLSLEGHEVHVAYTGGEALALAVAKPPELAFLDIGMPDMDGFELARRLRSVPVGDRPTLVAVTGWGRPDDIRKALEAGFDHHVTKSLDPDVLPALFREAK